MNSIHPTPLHPTHTTLQSSHQQTLQHKTHRRQTVQPTILAIETALHKCSVALQLANGQQDFVAASKDFMQSEMLVCLIEQLLHKHEIWYEDLDYVACTIGPGSFAGVRAGVAAVRAIRTLVPIIKALGFGTLEVLSFRAGLERWNEAEAGFELGSKAALQTPGTQPTQGETIVCLQHRNSFYWAKLLTTTLTTPQVAKITELDWGKVIDCTGGSQPKSTTTIIATSRIESAPSSTRQEIIALDASAVMSFCRVAIERDQTAAHTDLAPLYVGEPNVSGA